MVQENINLEKSAIYRAVKVARYPCFKFFPALRKILFLVFVFSLFYFLYLFLIKEAAGPKPSQFLGLSLISLFFGIILWEFGLFFNLKLKEPKPALGGGSGAIVSGTLNISGVPPAIDQALASPQSFNLADFLSLEAAVIVKEAQEFCKKNKLPFNTTAIFNSFFLNNSCLFSFVFLRLLLPQKEIQKLVKENLKSQPNEESQNLSLLFNEALKSAQKRRNLFISEGNLLSALAKTDPLFRNILIETDLKADDIENLTWWWERSMEKQEEAKKFWQYKNLIKFGSLGKSWTTGYTLTLDQFSLDWSDFIGKKGFEEIVGHEKEIGQIERILARGELKNALVVGEAGSGRGAMIQALAQKILFGESLQELNYQRVVELDLSLVVNRCQGQEEVGQVLETIFQETLLAKNVILVLQDFHNFIGGKSRPGTIDISGTLLSFLRHPGFRVVAVTTPESFHQLILPNPIAPLFEKVEVSEVSQQDTILLLELLTPGWEAKYKKFISYPAMREVVKKTARYLPAVPFPKKATDLMGELMAALSQTKEKVLLPKHVDQIISEKTEIPVGKISLKEKEMLLNMENILHQRIINQEEAVKEVSSALRRARADITIRKGPMGAFLFLGPTGVGKTETAKALAAVYFGNEEKIIRLDLSEFQNPQDLKRLIGSVDEQSFFVNSLREDPFSLVLLDEIEKAHPNILNLFLQVIDEGFFHDGLGRKVSFLNTIIIATSNAGYQVILKAIEQGLEMPSVKEKLLNYVFDQSIFRPEFINRFDAVVVFKGLTYENLVAIAELMLAKLRKNLQEKEIELVITEELKAEVAKLGFDPVFGARQMRRVIQDKVENAIATGLLSGQIRRGNKITIKVPDFKLETI